MHEQKVGSSIASRSVTDKPAALKGAVAFTAVGMLAALIGGVQIIAGGPEALRDFVAEYVARNFGTITETAIDLAVDEVYQTVQARAVVWIVISVLGFAALLAAKGGRTFGRVLSTIVSLVAIAFAVLNLADVLPTVLQVCSMVTLLGCAIGLVTLWFPAVGRYARSRQAA